MKDLGKLLDKEQCKRLIAAFLSAAVAGAMLSPWQDLVAACEHCQDRNRYVEGPVGGPWYCSGAPKCDPVYDTTKCYYLHPDGDFYPCTNWAGKLTYLWFDWCQSDDGCSEA